MKRFLVVTLLTLLAAFSVPVVAHAQGPSIATIFVFSNDTVLTAGSCDPTGSTSPCPPPSGYPNGSLYLRTNGSSTLYTKTDAGWVLLGATPSNLVYTNVVNTYTADGQQLIHVASPSNSLGWKAYNSVAGLSVGVTSAGVPYVNVSNGSGVDQGSVFTVTTVSSTPSVTFPGVITASSGVVGSLTGTATNATNVGTTAVSANASFFPLMVASSSNGNQAASLVSGLTYNPSTHVLTTTTFAGTATAAGTVTSLSGHAATELSDNSDLARLSEQNVFTGVTQTIHNGSNQAQIKIYSSTGGGFYMGAAAGGGAFATLVDGSGNDRGSWFSGSPSNLSITFGGLVNAPSGGFVGALTGNASTATNGVVTTGSYSDPAWITALALSKITTSIASTRIPYSNGSALTSSGNLAFDGTSFIAGADGSLNTSPTGTRVMVNGSSVDGSASANVDLLTLNREGSSSAQDATATFGVGKWFADNFARSTLDISLREYNGSTNPMQSILTVFGDGRMSMGTVNRSDPHATLQIISDPGSVSAGYGINLWLGMYSAAEGGTHGTGVHCPNDVNPASGDFVSIYGCYSTMNSRSQIWFANPVLTAVSGHDGTLKGIEMDIQNEGSASAFLPWDLYTKVAFEAVLGPGSGVDSDVAFSAVANYGGSLAQMWRTGFEARAVSGAAFAAEPVARNPAFGGSWVKDPTYAYLDDTDSTCSFCVAAHHTTGHYILHAFQGGTDYIIIDKDGSISNSTGTYTTSDERRKDVRGNFRVGLSEIRGIVPIDYTFKASTGLDPSVTYSGFSAQNVQRFIPQAVASGPSVACKNPQSGDLEPCLTVNALPITAALVNGERELADRVEALEALNGIVYHPKHGPFARMGLAFVHLFR